jgi:hypothetical protein
MGQYIRRSTPWVFGLCGLNCCPAHALIGYIAITKVANEAYAVIPKFQTLSYDLFLLSCKM